MEVAKLLWQDGLLTDNQLNNINGVVKLSRQFTLPMICYTLNSYSYFPRVYWVMKMCEYHMITNWYKKTSSSSNKNTTNVLMESNLVDADALSCNQSLSLLTHRLISVSCKLLKNNKQGVHKSLISLYPSILSAYVYTQ